MGAIADAFVAYARPLLDQTDGSEEQLNKAFAISQLCYNLSLMPEDSRDRVLGEMKPTLDMDDEEFDDFRRSIVIPMIRRHQEMFPQMHRPSPTDSWQSVPSENAPPFRTRPRMAARTEAYPKTDRYAPCPCNSGKKYKFCCGKKRL
ncbi:MAG: SEC-C domain-containing protein [Pirellulales bacterium]|nr:SEC-C domain-containing protein [Pirellulales bacterium]